MRIDLKLIDEDGKDLQFNQSSDETLGLFKDLIGENPFHIDLKLSPLGNSYQLMGQIQSEYAEICSLCGEDITVPIGSRVHEIIVVEKQRPRNTQVSQSQQNFDSNSPSVTYLNEPYLEITELLHELMASSLTPFPKCTDEKACEQRQEKIRQVMAENATGHPGFEALKGLKLKH